MMDLRHFCVIPYVWRGGFGVYLALDSEFRTRRLCLLRNMLYLDGGVSEWVCVGSLVVWEDEFFYLVIPFLQYYQTVWRLLPLLTHCNIFGGICILIRINLCNIKGRIRMKWYVVARSIQFQKYVCINMFVTSMMMSMSIIMCQHLRHWWPLTCYNKNRHVLLLVLLVLLL